MGKKKEVTIPIIKYECVDMAHEPGRLSLEEMYRIFMSDDYKDYRNQNHLEVLTLSNGKKTIRKKNLQFIDYFSPSDITDLSLLHRHIKAEEYLIQRYSKSDWSYWFLSNFKDTFNLCYIWLHPLFWLDSKKQNDMIIVNGRVAKERFDEGRKEVVEDAIFQIEKCRALYFADQLPENEIGLPGFTDMYHLHNWKLITLSYENALKKVLSGHQLGEEDYGSMKKYDAPNLRRRILTIEGERGGQKAASLIRMLQNEWNQIKIWDPDIKNMTSQEIEDFEKALHSGFDDLLKDWENKETESDFAFVIEQNQTQNIVNKILSYLKGKETPKDVMMPIRAAIDAGVIRRPTDSELRLAFPGKCPKNKSSVSYYTNPDNKPYVGDAYNKMVEDFKKIS